MGRTNWKGIRVKYYSYNAEGLEYDPIYPSQIIKGGIYTITNTVNGKIYIGSSSDIEARWSEHTRKLRNGVHGNIYLQRSWVKYGEESFKFEVIERVRKSRLIERESFHIKSHA